ncbi:MAG TPA: hypothetical protein DIS66_02375 [Candidatus Omnitrophica bacterium]|nr:hypothetical protein [Candidatus Omnitrophota bacterium]
MNMAEETAVKKLVKLTVDGKPIEVPIGTRLIEAARMTQEDVPYYCYHPGLSIAGNCRMCQVEIEGIPKLQIACHMEAKDGMVVHTKNEKVLKTRQHMLEFLLVNHPVDCPVCDQAGECWLQDYYMKHGLHDSRVNEDKVSKPKAVPIGPNVMLDNERCILCSRCVRFTDEISKTRELGISNRGDHSEVQVFPGKQLNNPYSGNVVDICPVGALTDRDFRFKIRVWYLKSGDSVCGGCSRGCNIQVHTNLDRPQHGTGRVKRLKPRYNAEVNQWWMCDAGRYDYKYHDENRVLAARKTGAQAFEETVLKEIAAKLKASKKTAVILSPQMTNEELYLARKLFRDELKLQHLYLASPKKDGFSDDILIKADKNPNRKGAENLGFTETPEKFESLFGLSAKGEVDGWIIFGQDLLSLYPKAREVFSKLNWSLFIGSNENETSKLAGFVLPSATSVEKDGTWTNFDGRTQAFRKVLEPAGEAKSEIRFLTQLGALVSSGWSAQTAEAVYQDLAAKEKSFPVRSYADLSGTASAIRVQAAPTVPSLQQYDNIL